MFYKLFLTATIYAFAEVRASTDLQRELVRQTNCLWEILKLKQNFQRNKVATRKTPFLVSEQFCTPNFICLTLNSGSTVLYGHVLFSVLVLTFKKLFPIFLKKVFVLRKICFKVKVLKTFKISTDLHIKACWSLKWRSILKILSTFFLEKSRLFMLTLKCKPLRQCVFLC